MSRHNNVSYGSSAAERREAMEAALGWIDCAMEDLRGFGEFEDTFNTLSDLYDELVPVVTKLQEEEAGEYNEMIAELKREYYRSVL